MPVTTGDFAHVKAATMATDFSTANVGGTKTATAISAALAGDIFFTMASNLSGDGTRNQYSKSFVRNNHASDSGYSCKFFLENALDNVSGNQIINIVSDSASDGNTKKVRILGYDTSGDPLQVEVTLNGTTPVSTGSTQFSDVHRIELRLVSGGALTNAAGNLQFKHNTTEIGYIPAGLNSATAEVKIGVALAMDDSVTIANAGTAPTSVSFFKPRILADALGAQNGGVIPFGQGQGLWWLLAVKEMTKPSSLCTSSLMFSVQAA